MKLGVTFPQVDFGRADAGAIRAYAQAAQDLGYDYLLVYDHVLGADTTNRPDWSGAYTAVDPFHEPFTLFAFMAAAAPELEYVTGVIILPQRQTALVAKQAAELDILTGGKFRLGAGIGWNAVEFEALNEEFGNRAKRFEEQVEVLRRLWTEPIVTFQGVYHRITEAGLNPMPVQRPIPIWIGGTAEAVLRRTARIGDGWFPLGRCTPERLEQIERLRGYVAAAGRESGSVGIDARIDMRTVPEPEWPDEVARWRDAGVTHLSINTMYQGYSTDEHIAAIGRFIDVARTAR